MMNNLTEFFNMQTQQSELNFTERTTTTPIPPTTTHKKCGHCGEIKPLNEFHMDKTTVTGRGSWCKECTSTCRGKTLSCVHAKGKKTRYSVDRTRGPAYATEEERRMARKIQRVEWVKNNPEKRAFQAKKAQAKEHNNKFELDEDVWVPLMKNINGTKCPDCGRHAHFNVSMDNRGQSLSFSFDQIHAGKGYTDENTRFICVDCNTGKSNIKVEEWMRVLEYRIECGLISKIDPYLLRQENEIHHIDKVPYYLTCGRKRRMRLEAKETK